MPGSVTSVFGEPEDFEAALRADGVLSLLVTGHGRFRARLTQVTLHGLRLSAGDEYLPRIAFIAIPADTVLVSLPIGSGPWPVWGGMEMQASEIITLGPGQRVYARTDGPCCWGAIRIPAEDLAQYARALSGAEFVVPTAARWRPPRAALRQLRHFHGAAVRRVEARSAVLADSEAAHGLEQQMIEALVECVSAGPVEEETGTAARHRAILARFENLLRSQPLLGIAEVRAALGASERTLRECCKKHLGMAPSRYRRLRGMQLAHRALRSGSPDASSVPAVARRYGFRDLGRFAANYRALFGELPSVTLRRGPHRGLTALTLGRPHVKVS
jgi:AraC family ethanolamine operon transcriptional activator